MERRVRKNVSLKFTHIDIPLTARRNEYFALQTIYKLFTHVINFIRFTFIRIKSQHLYIDHSCNIIECNLHRLVRYKFEHIVSFAVHPLVQVPNQLVGAPTGTDVTLQCHVEASPKAINYWTRENGKLIYFVSSQCLLQTNILKQDFYIRL